MIPLDEERRGRGRGRSRHEPAEIDPPRELFPSLEATVHEDVSGGEHDRIAVLEQSVVELMSCKGRPRRPSLSSCS